jgi:hypothetical protein
MKTLSIHGNYILDILAGRKTEEYRSWKTNHRGALLLASTVNTKEKPTVPGHLLAVVDIVDVTGTDGDYAWQIENVRAITPVPNKGQLQLYERDDNLIHYRPDLDHLTTAEYLDKLSAEGIKVIKGTNKHRSTNNASDEIVYYDNGFLKNLFY